MKFNLKRTSVIGTVFLAGALLTFTGVANAGGQFHKMPAEANQTDPAYEIRMVTMPGQGHPLTVQVINKQTGQPVTNAHVTMRHWVPGHVKNAPGPQQAMIPLEPDGHGGYVCTREHVGHGERVVLRAHVPGDLEGTWAELTIDS